MFPFNWLRGRGLAWHDRWWVGGFVWVALDLFERLQLGGFVLGYNVGCRPSMGRQTRCDNFMG